MKEMEALINVKSQFIDSLNEHIAIYVTIGSGINESPMWLQLAGEVDGHLVFKSSQNRGIGFKIPSPEGFKLYSNRYLDVYDFFKRIKYEHIRDHWPSVFKEIKGGQAALINNFLNS